MNQKMIDAFIAECGSLEDWQGDKKEWHTAAGFFFHGWTACEKSNPAPVENLKVLVYELDFWSYSIDVRLECVQQIDGPDLWAIREKGCCLNKQGEWEIEPIPSSRTSTFYKRCRWKSAEAALKFWRASGCRSRFEHYRT